ncbi:MAG: uracil-DNA glycosylase [Treponema sp.]|nr:uracil-DNA glycosylase [Treponema sp.]
MTAVEKQKIAEFLDIAGDYLSCGYRGDKKDYIFNDEEQIEAPWGAPWGAPLEDSLEKIALEIQNCKNCPLCAARKNAVPGEGVSNPVVLVIGEGPGADEDLQGRPFVGKAGQLLDKMLEAIQLSRKTNCFIANVVKCRPPNNRDPHPQEAEICSTFLQRQIEVLKPKFILLVGIISAKTVIKSTQPVGNIRGKFIDYKTDNLSIPLLVTYHPAALLRTESYKRPAWEDLKLLRSRIDALEN